MVRVSTVGLLLLVSTGLPGALPVAEAASTLINIHVSGAGTPADLAALGEPPSLTTHGRYVAFASPATNLVPADTNGASDIFIYDALTGTITLASRAAGGTLGNGASRHPSLSADGRYVAFESAANNLVTGDTNGLTDVFRLDRDSDTDDVLDEPGAVSLTLVSQGLGGLPATGASRCTAGAISADGSRVVFESDASNLVGGDGNGATDCLLWSGGSISRVSLTSAGLEANGPTLGPVLSGDGSMVAFTSAAATTNLVPGDANAATDVLVRDLAAGTTIRVSVGAFGVEGNGASSLPSLSADGQRIAFESFAGNLVADDTNLTGDIFVHDRVSGGTVRASVATGGYQSTGRSQGPALSPDGEYVAFFSAATDLVGGDTNAVRDVFLHTLATGLTSRASLSLDGSEANSGSLFPAISEAAGKLVFVSGATNLAPFDSNGVNDIFLLAEPLSGGGGGDDYTVDTNPVTFSVNGPVDPHTEGLRDARGAPASPQSPVLPGNPLAFGVRAGPVPAASGVNSAMTGDLFDYAGLGVPAEAVIFQSRLAPTGIVYTPGPTPMPPDTTNNQIMQAPSIGLAGGGAVPAAGWSDPAPRRDNVDAFSFGEDFFPATMTLGLASGAFPDPPVDGSGEIAPSAVPWPARTSAYREPIVTTDGAGASFRFSVDPWAIGRPATAVRAEAGASDPGSGTGPWQSPGEAAADVFGTLLLSRSGGVTGGGAGANVLVHEEYSMALLPNASGALSAEDDIDALECVGSNLAPWDGTNLVRAGNIHFRVHHFGPPGFPPVAVTSHTVYTTGSGNFAPLFFSVTRNSPGDDSTAVNSQFLLDGGAAADVFIAVKRPGEPEGIGRSLLFLDEAELGLQAVDQSVAGSGPLDLTDDLDALILSVCPEYRDDVKDAVAEIFGGPPYYTLGGAAPWAAGAGGALTGGGMTQSIVRYLGDTGRPVPPGCIQVGFSVSTDATGLLFSAVDWEAGPVDPAGGISAAAGDIFYAEADGDPVNPNYLWHEETALGLDPGDWRNGVSGDFADLPDNLDGLDSIDEAPRVAGVPDGGIPRADPVRLLEFASPNPFQHRTVLSFVLAAPSPVRLSIHDASGRLVTTLVDRTLSSGRHALAWDGAGVGGLRVPAGVYFARLSLPGRTESRKLTVLN